MNPELTVWLPFSNSKSPPSKKFYAATCVHDMLGLERGVVKPRPYSNLVNFLSLVDVGEFGGNIVLKLEQEFKGVKYLAFATATKGMTDVRSYHEALASPESRRTGSPLTDLTNFLNQFLPGALATSPSSSPLSSPARSPAKKKRKQNKNRQCKNSSSSSSSSSSFSSSSSSSSRRTSLATPKPPPATTKKDLNAFLAGATFGPSPDNVRSEVRDATTVVDLMKKLRPSDPEGLQKLLNEVVGQLEKSNISLGETNDLKNVLDTGTSEFVKLTSPQKEGGRPSASSTAALNVVATQLALGVRGAAAAVAATVAAAAAKLGLPRKYVKPGLDAAAAMKEKEKEGKPPAYVQENRKVSKRLEELYARVQASFQRFLHDNDKFPQDPNAKVADVGWKREMIPNKEVDGKQVTLLFSSPLPPLSLS